MARLSVNALTTYRWSFDEHLHYAREAGYDGVGLWLRKVRDFGEERAIELVQETGLRVSSVSWSGGFTGADAATAEENLLAAEEALALCGDLGADCLTIYTGGRNGHIARHADRLLRSALDRLLPAAEVLGVPLALEPLHPACAEGWTLLTSLPETLRLVRDYDTPSLRMALDTYHFPLPPHDWPLLVEAAPYLSVVHLGDLTEPHGVDQARVPLGEGTTPLGGIVSTLIAAGYQGFFDLKLFGPAFDAADYHELLAGSLQTFASLAAGHEPAATTARREACKAI